MTVKKIAILYIATGSYDVFWKDFYQSSEEYFLNSDEFEKNYFIFSDNLSSFSDAPNIHKYYQNNLPWPYITLLRFDIFNKARALLEKMDYIYFFNSNMLFVNAVGKEILPDQENPLVMVKHPGFFDKPVELFSYENNPSSLAAVKPGEGEYYFMGGLNGGVSKRYLQLVDTLSFRVQRDFDNNVMAVWHDESHLNRYGIDYKDEVKVMSPAYGYQQDKSLPFEKKIIIRDKNYYGGHDTLRNRKSKIRAFIDKLSFERRLRKAYKKSI